MKIASFYIDNAVTFDDLNTITSLINTIKNKDGKWIFTLGE